MSRFVVLSFLGLGWAFYELSGGADFQPRLPPVPVAEAPIRAVAPVTPRQASAERAAVRVSELVAAPVIAPERPAANPELRREIRAERLGQAADSLNQGLALVPGVQSGGQLTLASLEQGLAGLSATEQAPARTETAEATETSDADIRRVNATRVNLRDGPGTNFDVVARLTRDTSVEILTDDGTGWVELRLVDTGQTGWMADYLLTATN